MCIAQAEAHNLPLVLAIWCDECRLRLIFFIDSNLVETACKSSELNTVAPCKESNSWSILGSGQRCLMVCVLSLR